MKKIVITIICILILFVYQITKTNGESLKPVSTDFVVIKNQKVFLDVADNREKITRGLMGVDNIAENQGMVFLFKKHDYKTFWMKNMKIPLDIVFISNEKIAKIYKEVPVCEKDPCTLYGSKYKIDSVIEFKKGFCEKYNVKVGDKIKFSQDIKRKKAGLKEN
ncbi:MAG: hypothetical protein A2039_02275 [Candidatus Melainabacteria bacterium GWA2_34_9]|nr:MAG: hypothetical protein A2039_02275 [Candidatus Melainabacteria bacterium GWA2_34_9]